MKQWEAVIGLEVHTQLNTNTKIFCGCSTEPTDQPNTNVCPVCMGLPGSLPVLNEEAVNSAIRAGLALGCSISTHNEFARKNYFYPDLPKGYQISQFDKPICVGGTVEIVGDNGQPKHVQLNRIHMEEDAGKTVHGEGADASSYVDYNRTGVPLLEIVTEPDMCSAKEAVNYLRNLHQIISYCGVSNANMEQGQFRCDANISVRPVGQKELGTKAEMKNMNSFRNIEKAIEYEIGRQIALLTQGGEVVQETRLWDAGAGKSRSMRSKEDAHDYRYFPDPDLLPLRLTNQKIDTIRSKLPEMPEQRKQRYREQYGLSEYDAKVLTDTHAVAFYFEQILQKYTDAKKAANWILSEILRETAADEISSFSVPPEYIAQLLNRIDDGTISGKIAKELFRLMIESGKSADLLIDEKGLKQVSDSTELEATVQKVLQQFPEESERYRQGEKKLTGFFMGQIMQQTQGKANPKIVQELIAKILST